MDGTSGEKKHLLGLRKDLILVAMLVGLVPLLIATGVSYDLARSLHPDVISMDVHMPVMDGLRALDGPAVRTPA